nr:M23 family metallopeptidase [Specibacter cremeus]
MHGASQKVGLTLAATGLVLTVSLPATSGTLAAEETPLVHEDRTVSARADAPIDFAAPAVASSLDADGRLKQTLKVEASHVAPAAAKGTLGAPLRSMVPSSPFGQRVSPITGEVGETHRGQDFAIACGTDVFAAAGGTVTFAGWHPYGGGNRVVVDHGNGLSTTYNHLSEIKVTVGQKLERGQVLALSGTTGASTGCHLHFEVMVDDEVVDPMGWL